MKRYIKPETEVLETSVYSMLCSMSLKDEQGGSQLTKEYETEGDDESLDIWN